MSDCVCESVDAFLGYLPGMKPPVNELDFVNCVTNLPAFVFSTPNTIYDHDVGWGGGSEKLFGTIPPLLK